MHVVSHIWMSDATHTNESRATCDPSRHKKWVIRGVCHTYICVCTNTASISHHHLRENYIYIYMYICIYVYMYICITPLFAWILNICIHIYITVCANIIHVSIHVYIYVYICIDICFYIYIHVYIYVYIYIFISNQICISKYGIGYVSQIRLRDQITPLCAWMLLHALSSVLRKSKTAWLPYVQHPSHFASAVSARSSPLRQYVCVSYCIYIFTHTLAWWPPPHTKWVLMCMHTTRDTRLVPKKQT